MFTPDGGTGTLREQRLLDLLLIAGVRQRPTDAGRLRGGQVFVDGALGNRTTAGDLMLAQSEGMEPQNFLQLAHGQPLLWQLGVSTFSGVQSPRLPYAVLPISCRSPFRTTTVKPIGISSEH